ncbi:class I SAM-dependent methyltransferase [Saccharopolyspora sp. NFXS83]|uniref:class I SAM-dependent methyltransferase n=1 Tax=Saccharopolyspora sp. NFXS83 TaxID=2993560 RepID=UPI00224A49FD|nr:class I SAM-dependent methyltransferase [Saccharopolyspora sp. NFXS83]MCX2732659.1 class I SAM-dependent methyltransferase [Saccharopolyspora sp. NFXS83]
MGSDDDALLAERLAYYRAAATEYDRPYAERADLRALLGVLDEFPVSGDVLEAACGTGQWTARLAARARSVTGVDAAAEPLAVARARCAADGVRFVQADLFEWSPPRRYDVVFFAFWLSHVPPALLARWWERVASMLVPGGAAIFVDDGPPEAAFEDVLDGDVPLVRRRLADGGEHRVVKVFHDADALTDVLTGWGWSARVRPVCGNFVAGVARPPA